MKPMLAILLTALLVAGGAHAERPCERSDESLSCLSIDHARTDKALNLPYKETMGRLSLDRRTELRKVQRDWIFRRDNECQNLMGTQRTLNCEINWTVAHTAELQLY